MAITAAILNLIAQRSYTKEQIDHLEKKVGTLSPDEQTVLEALKEKLQVLEDKINTRLEESE